MQGFNPLVSGASCLACVTVDKQALGPSRQYGCDGVAVSTVGCGPAGPGSSPGHGPILTLFTAENIFLNLVPHPVYFGGQISAILIAHSDYQGHPLDYVDPMLAQLRYLVRIVR